MITRVGKVIVPVEDQQAALEFWTRCMAFTTVRDDSYGDERWIEVKPPNQDLLLVLSLRRPDEPRRTVPDRLPHSDLFFDCADIEQTHRQLSRPWREVPAPAVQRTVRLVGTLRGQRRQPLRTGAVGRSAAPDP